VQVDFSEIPPEATLSVTRLPQRKYPTNSADPNPKAGREKVETTLFFFQVHSLLS